MDLSKDAVQIPLGVDLSPLDRGLAEVPRHIAAAEAKTPNLKIHADLTGANVVAQQAASAVNVAGQAAVVQVNAVGTRVQALSNQVNATTAKAQQAVASRAAAEARASLAGGGWGGSKPPASGLDAFVRDTHRQLGGESTLGRMMSLGIQGGAIGMAANAASDLVKKVEAASVALASGEANASELTAELLREIPIVGKLGDAMARVGGLIAGDTLEVARLHAQTAKTDAVTSAMQAKLVVVRDHSKAIGEHIAGWNTQLAKLGLSGASARLADAAVGFGERTKTLNEETGKALQSEEAKKARSALDAARTDARAAQAAVSALPAEGSFHMGRLGADQGFNEVDSAYRARKKAEASSAADRVKTLEAQLAGMEADVNADWARGMFSSVKLFGGELAQEGKSQVIEQVEGTRKFIQSFLNRGAQAIGDANQQIREAEKKQNLENLSEGDRFLAEIREKTNDPATLANARRVAERMDAAAGAKAESEHAKQQQEKWDAELEKARTPKEVLDEKLAEIAGADLDKESKRRLRRAAQMEFDKATNASTKYELPAAMKYGGGEMASWQADLAKFMAENNSKEALDYQKRTAEATEKAANQSTNETAIVVTL